MSGTTTHVAEIAIPGQLEITVRASHGSLELGQESHMGEWAAIYVQPDNVLRLVRSMLLMIGMDDVYLYREKGGCCTDVDWPNDHNSEHALMRARPDIDWKAVNEDFNKVKFDDEVKPKDCTAAARQRRRRAKLREQKRDAQERDAVTVTPDLPFVNGQHQELAS